MKIFPDIVHPETAQATARTSAVYDAQWKKALEDAQWQARQRIAADTGDNQRPPDDSAPALRSGAANDSPAATMLPPAAMGGFTASRIGSARTDALGQALIDAIAPPARARLAQTNGFAASGPPAAAPGRTAPAMAGSYSPLDSLERAPPRQLQFNGLPEWPAVVVHASVAGNRISLVIRDRNVTAGEATALHQRLRNQLRASGLELAELTLNGQQVTGDGDAGPLTHVRQ